jgi:hypothetical protein
MRVDYDKDQLSYALANALKERDEAREALMKIEEIFIDGGDTYLDFVRVGNIAREFLERNKD